MSFNPGSQALELFIKGKIIKQKFKSLAAGLWLDRERAKLQVVPPSFTFFWHPRKKRTFNDLINTNFPSRMPRRETCENRSLMTGESGSAKVSQRFGSYSLERFSGGARATSNMERREISLGRKGVSDENIVEIAWKSRWKTYSFHHQLSIVHFFSSHRSTLLTECFIGFLSSEAVITEIKM